MNAHAKQLAIIGAGYVPVSDWVSIIPFQSAINCNPTEKKCVLDEHSFRWNREQAVSTALNQTYSSCKSDCQTPGEDSLNTPVGDFCLAPGVPLPIGASS